MDMNSIHQNFGTCHCLWELKVSKLFKYFTKNVNVFYYLDSEGLKRFFVATTLEKALYKLNVYSFWLHTQPPEQHSLAKYYSTQDKT